MYGFSLFEYIFCTFVPKQIKMQAVTITQITIDELEEAVERAVQRALGRQINPPADTVTWFNIDQLCEYLPDKPKKATIYGYVHAMAIPVHKRSRRLAFLKSEIDDWIKQGRRKTLDEISRESESIFKKKTGKAGRPNPQADLPLPIE